jgi:hypothetical protein
MAKKRHEVLSNFGRVSGCTAVHPYEKKPDSNVGTQYIASMALLDQNPEAKLRLFSLSTIKILKENLNPHANYRMCLLS